MKRKNNDIDCSKHSSSMSFREVDRCGTGLYENEDRPRVRTAKIQSKKKRVF